MPNWLPTAFAILVVSAWAVGFVVDLASQAYNPPAELTPLMLAVATWLFGVPAVRAWRNPDERDRDTDDKVTTDGRDRG